MIRRRRTEIRTHLDPDIEPATEAVASNPIEFNGPLADLKRFAHRHSRRGVRFYVRQRKTEAAPTIRIEVRTNGQREGRGFSSEEDARRFIEACSALGISKS